MEWWIRLKAMCGFGCFIVCTPQGLCTLPMSWGWLAAMSPGVDRTVGADPSSLPGSKQLYFSSETYRQKKERNSYLCRMLFLLIPLLLVGNPAPWHPLTFAVIDLPGEGSWGSGSSEWKAKTACDSSALLSCPHAALTKRQFVFCAPTTFEDSGKRAC